MIARIAAGLVGGIIIAALVLVGVAFAAFAIFFALIPAVGVAWAAAVTAFILLIGPAGFALGAMARGRRRETNASVETIVLKTLSSFARDKPLSAVLAAGLLGAVGMMLRRRR